MTSQGPDDDAEAIEEEVLAPATPGAEALPSTEPPDPDTQTSEGTQE